MSPEIIVFSLNSMEKMDWEDVLIEMGGVRGMGGSPCEKGITILCLLPSVMGTQGFTLKVPSASNGHKDLPVFKIFLPLLPCLTRPSGLSWLPPL